MLAAENSTPREGEQQDGRGEHRSDQERDRPAESRPARRGGEPLTQLLSRRLIFVIATAEECLLHGAIGGGAPFTGSRHGGSGQAGSRFRDQGGSLGNHGT